MEKITNYVGTNYGQDICTELRNKTSLIIPEPTHTADIMARYTKQSKVTRDNQTDLQAAREEQFRDLQDEIRAGNKSAKMPLAHLKAEIKAAEYMMTLDIPIDLTEAEKTAHNNACWKSHRARIDELAKH
jgi:hypothetical protein